MASLQLDLDRCIQRESKKFRMFWAAFMSDSVTRPSYVFQCRISSQRTQQNKNDQRLVSKLSITNQNSAYQQTCMTRDEYAGRYTDQKRVPASTRSARKTPGMTKKTANEQGSKGCLCLYGTEISVGVE